MSLIIRECRIPDEVVPLTDLLHRAYAELAASGMHFVASHQSPEITEKRIRSGRCLVAEDSGRLVGTITVRTSRPGSQIPLYREDGVVIIGQFGVEPSEKRKGIGRALHERAVQYAMDLDARVIALDTAEPALELIQTYVRWGYRKVARHKWASTNYESIVMAKVLKTFSDATDATPNAAPFGW